MKLLITGIVFIIQAGAQSFSGTSMKGTSIMTVPALPGTVATPTDSPGQGTYASAQTVSLSTATSGATICYTTDGTTPSRSVAGACTVGTTYSAAFPVSATTTLKFLGIKAGMTNSAVVTSLYTISAGAPVFQPTVISGQDIPSPSGGDTQSCLWTSAATKPGSFGGGSIVCVYNDGADSTVPTGMCNGGGGGNSICVYQMTAYDKTTVVNTHFSALNYMGSYGAKAASSCYDTRWGIQMKSRKMFAVGSIWLMPIFCMSGYTHDLGHDFEGWQSGFIVSTDLGAHWCNYKTFQANSNTCTAVNGVANGDNPVDAAGFQWPINDGTNRMSRISLVDFLCQDNTVSCPVAVGVDPAYLYAMADSSDEQTTTLIRGLKSDGILLMLPSHWQAYTAGGWVSNLQAGDNIVIPNGGIGCCGTVVYIADFNSFGMWQHPTGFAKAPAPWGPWTAGNPVTPTRQGFPAPVAGLCPKHDVAGRVTCTVLAAPSDDLSIYEEDLGAAGGRRAVR